MLFARRNIFAIYWRSVEFTGRIERIFSEVDFFSSFLSPYFLSFLEFYREYAFYGLIRQNVQFMDGRIYGWKGIFRGRYALSFLSSFLSFFRSAPARTEAGKSRFIL